MLVRAEPKNITQVSCRFSSVLFREALLLRQLHVLTKTGRSLRSKERVVPHMQTHHGVNARLLYETKPVAWLQRQKTLHCSTATHSGANTRQAQSDSFEQLLLRFEQTICSRSQLTLLFSLRRPSRRL